jgi:DNA-binding winged helix-turn-helix (wHTH) protein/tetratricopeptide (TPR) repeat protein
MRYRFADFELDLTRGTLVHAGAEVEIRPKLLTLLAYLVRHAGRVVPKNELLAEIWPGVHVSEATLASTLRDLRRLLEDRADEPRYVQSLWSRGIRFVAPVRAVIDGAVEAGAERRATPATTASSFVGRGDLLDSADDWIGAALAGRGRAILLAGEAGIGKSRAGLEVARRAEARGLAIHVGRCLEERGAPPYWPWSQIIRSVLRELPAKLGADDAIVTRALRLLPERGADPEHPAPSDGDAARFQLFDAVTQLVLASAHGRPCVLLLDDLHRADRSSAALLRHLLREIAHAPLLVLGALRGAEVPREHPLAAMLAELHPGGESIALRALSESEVAALIERAAGFVPSSELVGAVHERSGGNPLFVEHLVRTLERQGAIDAPDAAMRAAHALPTQASAVIREGVDRLPGDVTAVLECAAVIGRSFDLDVLAATTGAADRAALDDTLDVAIVAGLIGDGPSSGELRFGHILTRDALYDALSSHRRVALHAAVGDALERLRAYDLDAHLDELAHHFAQAAAHGEAARALRYARQAGERALARAAYPEAAARFEAALHALDFGEHDESTDPRRLARVRAELLVLLGQALWRSGSTGEARERFAAGFDLARATRDAETLARAALGFVGRTDVTPGVNHEAVAMLECALAALPESDSALRAELLARLGTELYYDDARGRSDPLTGAAVAMAERLDDPELLAYTLSARHYALTLPSVDPSERLELLDRLVALAERTHALDALTLGLQESVAELLEIGDAARLDVALRRHRVAVESLRQPFFRWVHTFLMQMRSLLAGSLDEADRLAHEALALGQSVGSPNAVPLFGVQLYCVRREQGRLGELVSLFERVVEENPVFTAYRSGLAEVYLQLGRREDARALFEQVMARDLDDFARDKDWPAALGVLSPVCVALGDERRARLLYRLFEPLEGRMIAVAHGGACFGAISHHRARLAATFGDIEAACDHFEDATGQLRRAGAPLFLAHAQRDWAQLLWKCGAPHERELAATLRAEAANAYDRLGLSAHVTARTPSSARSDGSAAW